MAKFGSGYFLINLNLKCLFAFLSLLLAIFLKYLFYKLVGLIHGAEYMSGAEEFWLFDWAVNPCNLHGILIIQRPKGDPEEIMEQIREKLMRRNTPNGRFDHKIVKILGKYYFKRLDDQERAEFKKNNFKVIRDVTDFQGILDFANKFKQIEVKFKQTSAYHIFYFPNIGTTEACVIGYGPHVLQDGISSMQQFYQMSDQIETDKSFYPYFDLPAPSFAQWALIYLTAPYQWYNVIKHWKARGDDRNCIKRRVLLTGEQKSKMATIISLKKAKQVAKDNGISYNDLMLAIVSQSFRNHFDQQGDNTSTITIAMPFAFYKIPRDPDHYTIGNRFATLCLYLDLHSDFKAACADAKKKTDQIKKAMIAPGLFSLLWLYGNVLPTAFYNHVFVEAGAKCTALVSSVPTFSKPFTMFGGQTKHITCPGTGTGSMATTVNISSLNKRITFLVTADYSQIPDVPKFVEFVNQRIQELGIAYDEAEEGDD